MSIQERQKTYLKKGDMVMVVAGGHKEKRPIKGKVGKILRFVGNRAVVEGLNMFVRHQKPTGPNKPGGKVQREGPIHVSNLMYYVEKLKKPARLKRALLNDGKRVRGYVHPESGEFVQIAE